MSQSSRCVSVLAGVLLSGVVATAQAAPAAPDWSGTYDCQGRDASEGPYRATVTLTRVAAHSKADRVAYDFRMEVPNFGTYLGHAVSHGVQLAIHFGLANPASKDFGTGLATVQVRHGRTSFEKFYYEPAYKGGNHGTDHCIRR